MVLRDNLEFFDKSVLLYTNINVCKFIHKVSYGLYIFTIKRSHKSYLVTMKEYVVHINLLQESKFEWCLVIIAKQSPTIKIFDPPASF